MAPDIPTNTRLHLGLPPAVATPADVARLLRELDLVDESLLQQSLRSGNPPIKLPRTSHLLDQLIEFYQVNLLDKADRIAFKQYLATIKDKAPILHMSFSSDPPATFVEKLTVWLRREIHPQALLTIGLQPTIGAGCVLRTTNRYFDLSLRQHLAKKRDLLLKELVGVEAT